LCTHQNRKKILQEKKLKTEINLINTNETKISRGYRLKISTHSLIKGLQELTRDDTDTVLTESCLMLYKKVLTEKENNLLNNNKEIL
jgi:hypothetical protein